MPDPIRKITLSRYASQALASDPGLAREVDPANAARAPFGAAEIAQALSDSDSDDEASFKRRLRRLRRRVLLRTMARDLGGLADLAEVCETVSELADSTIRAALRWLHE